jgi:erythromycin esterase-like protein
MTMMSGMRRGMTADVMNPRDVTMGENLAWLASRDPSARLVVWGASSHFVRDRTGIDGDPAPLMVPAGHVVASRLPGEVYGVMFLAAEGQFGTARSAGSPRAPVDPPDPTTLDGLFAATDIERGFLDLRRLPAGGAWLDAPLTARPLGYAPMTTTWPKHFDGVVFIRRMSPSVPVVTGSAR